MSIQESYNDWAETYDSVENKTRDMEAFAIRSVLGRQSFNSILEAGCGTGKNTGFLKGISNQLVAADFSEEMMNVARSKFSPDVTFAYCDLNNDWPMGKFDLIVCSLVLEHIPDLGHVFRQAAATLDSNGKFYICELHPYRQLTGSRAKFEKDGAMIQLSYYIHHLSDFISMALENGFKVLNFQEWFDDNDRSCPPRLCSFIFEKVENI